MTSAENWPHRAKFLWHGPTPNTGQTNKFTKNYKFLSIKSQTVNKRFHLNGNSTHHFRVPFIFKFDSPIEVQIRTAVIYAKKQNPGNIPVVVGKWGYYANASLKNSET